MSILAAAKMIGLLADGDRGLTVSDAVQVGTVPNVGVVWSEMLRRENRSYPKKLAGSAFQPQPSALGKWRSAPHTVLEQGGEVAGFTGPLCSDPQAAANRQRRASARTR